MSNITGEGYARQRLLLAINSKQSEKGNIASGVDFSDAGPPNWNPDAWEGFKAAFGSYPFGVQADGSYIQPTSLAGAPAWVFEKMGIRRPPSVS